VIEERKGKQYHGHGTANPTTKKWITRWQAKEAMVASSEVWRIKMKNESRIIEAEINMKDSNASIQENKLPLDKDDQLLM
jgi:hypothetical protein